MAAGGPDTTLVRTRDRSQELDDARDAWTQRVRLYDLLHRFRAGVLVTRARDGGASARPMLVASVDESSDELGFLTSEHAACVEEIEADARATVVFQDARHQLTWAGRARIERERYRILRAWRPELAAWVSSAEDPELVLVIVRPQIARYWSTRPAVASAAVRALEWTGAATKPSSRHASTHYGEVRFEPDLDSDW
ncbi:MAG: pyridoxamine 5'-phosphate oxidase family protein [Sandaracinus sp.]